jgi:hypothetical protein
MKKKLSKIESFAKAKSEYIDFYQRTLLEPRCVINILEIGFNLESIKALQEVFPDALVHTLDFFGDNVSSIRAEEIESMGFFVYNIMGKNGHPRRFSEISSQFDIIIDRGAHPITRQFMFAHLFNENITPHGLYYMEDLDSIGALTIDAITNKTEKYPNNESCKDIAKAVFDSDRTFSNKAINVDSINKIIDETEWCDMDRLEKIAVFKKLKHVDNIRIKKQTKKEPDTGVIDPVKELSMPDTLEVQLIGNEPTILKKREKYGPVRKDILVSFFGKVTDAPEIYEVFGNNSDFYFNDLDSESELYRLEMARSIFTLCINDLRVFDALFNGTIPVIITNDISNTTDITPGTWKIVSTAADAMSKIDRLYTNSELMAEYIKNGQKMIKKLLS